jgi:DNA polymerase III subunit delta'
MKIIGHQKIARLLEKSIQNGRIAQAYLFSGPESVGKFMLAKEISGKIIGGDDFALDLIIIKPEIETNKKGISKEKEIKIDKIKEAQRELFLFPYRGKYRVLVIDNAHKLNESSQNALLKILEEPNKTSVIILVTHEEDKIIPTIRSRCQKIQFNLVSQKEMEEKLFNKDDTELISFSMGRPGLIVKMKNNEEEAESLKNIRQRFKSLSNSGINKRLELAEELSLNIPEAVRKMEFLIWTMHEEAMENPESPETIKSLKIADKLSESLEQIKNASANSRLILENLLLNI